MKAFQIFYIKLWEHFPQENECTLDLHVPFPTDFQNLLGENTPPPLKYEAVLPKKIKPNLLKPPNSTTDLQETQGAGEHINLTIGEAFSKIQTHILGALKAFKSHVHES